MHSPVQDRKVVPVPQNVPGTFLADEGMQTFPVPSLYSRNDFRERLPATRGDRVTRGVRTPRHHPAHGIYPRWDEGCQ